MNARRVPFYVEVPARANEEVDGTRNRPSPNVSISLHRPHKLGPLLPRLKTGRASVIFGPVRLLQHFPIPNDDPDLGQIPDAT